MPAWKCFSTKTEPHRHFHRCWQMLLMHISQRIDSSHVFPLRALMRDYTLSIHFKSVRLIFMFACWDWGMERKYAFLCSLPSFILLKSRISNVCASFILERMHMHSIPEFCLSKMWNEVCAQNWLFFGNSWVWIACWIPDCLPSTTKDRRFQYPFDYTDVYVIGCFPAIYCKSCLLLFMPSYMLLSQTNSPFTLQHCILHALELARQIKSPK